MCSTVVGNNTEVHLAGYESLFEEPYPLGKLDLVGVPDFAFGAMENWGLITYRETSLLVPEAVGSSADSEADVAPGGPSVQQLYSVPLTVAHELAHMWFGVHFKLNFLGCVCARRAVDKHRGRMYACLTGRGQKSFVL